MQELLLIKLNLSKTDKYLIEKNYDNLIPLYYYNTKSYSSQFYSKGKSKSITKEELEKLVNDSSTFFIIIPKKKKEESINDSFVLLEESKKNQIFKVN